MNPMFSQPDQGCQNSSEKRPFISATITAGPDGLPEQSSDDGTSNTRTGTIKTLVA